MDEFKVQVAPGSLNKKYNVFKLHKDDNVDWSETKMRRENEYQPWQIKSGAGKTSRRYKATREGGVGDNASYFIFYKPNEASDTYEVCPVEEWYSLSATQRYKTLTAEEAEQKFEQRHKTLNLFSVMKKKNGENSEEGGNYAQDTKAFKVSELDEWGDSDGDDDNDDNDGPSGDESGEDGKKKKRKKAVKKEEPDDPPEEAKEESDEGDFEQRELDYMSDTSSDMSDADQEKDETDVKGIAEEEALRDLLSTDEEDNAEGGQPKGIKSGDLKSTFGSDGQDADGSRSEDSSDSDDYDVDEDKMDDMLMKKGLPMQLTMVKQEPQQPETTSSNMATASSRSQTTGGNKRKLAQESASPAAAPSASVPPPKRPCPAETSSFPQNSLERMVEDLIKKYLGRRPMTLKTLLKDVRTKLKRMEGAPANIENDLVVNIMSTILKKISPERQQINGEMYYSLGSK